MNETKKRFRLTWIVVALIGIVCLVRLPAVEAQQLWTLALALALVTAVGAVILAAMGAVAGDESSARFVVIGSIASSAFAVHVGSLAILAVGANLAVLWEWLLDWFHGPEATATQTALLAFAMTAVGGGGLFIFRLRWRCLYGATEVIAGIVVAVHRAATDPASRVTDMGFMLVMLTAGIYLVVRGLDNIHQGLTKEPIDPVATKWQRDLEAWIDKKLHG